MSHPATKRAITDDERRLGVNLPGLLRERLRSSNGGMCTVDDEAWILFAVPGEPTAGSRPGAGTLRTFAEETERLRREHGDRVPAGLLLAERIIAPGYLLLTPKGRLVRWDPVAGDVVPARVSWAPPVPERRHRRSKEPDTIALAVDHVRDHGGAVLFRLPDLEPAVVLARSGPGFFATAAGGHALTPDALHALGGTIDPQLIALGWRLDPDWGWGRGWPATADSGAIARAISDTFDHAYGLRADMVVAEHENGEETEADPGSTHGHLEHAANHATRERA